MDQVHATFGGRGLTPERPNFSKGTCQLPVPVQRPETVDGLYIPATHRGVARATDGRLVAYWACGQRGESWVASAHEGDADWPLWAEATAILAGCRHGAGEAEHIGAQAILAGRSQRRCEAGWVLTKRAYWTRAEAECVALVLTQISGMRLRAYECPHCRDWHLTRQCAGEPPRRTEEILAEYHTTPPVEGRVVRMGTPGGGRGNTIAIVD